MSIIIDGNSGISSAGGAPIVNTNTNPSSLGTVTSVTSIGNVTINAVGSGIAYPDGSLQNTVGYTGFRNRIINGDMRIDQRYNGASFTVATGDGVQYGPDRVRWQKSGTFCTATGQQVATVPSGSGFTNSLLATITTGGTAASTDYLTIGQTIEGYNVSDLAYGTTAAKSVTVSFWAQASIAGTYSASLWIVGISSFYVNTFSLSANTWTYITLTFPGNTAQALISTTTSAGLGFRIDLGSGSSFNAASGSWQSVGIRTAGSVTLSATTGATFYLTGVQLEVGSTATPFERRQFGTEVGLCQRYYCKTFALSQIPGNNLLTAGALRGTARIINASSQIEPGVTWRFPVSMRATPSTITLYSPAASGATNGQWTNDGNGSYSANARYIFQNSDGLTIDNSGTLLAANQPWIIHASADAEL
jgi:hypothetical protein